MTKRNVHEIISELSNYSSPEIEFVLRTLMLNQKIDFARLNNAYVASLESIRQDSLDKLHEAEQCIAEGFVYDNQHKDEGSLKSIQRRLYLLNQSKRFQMDKLNKRFKYDEDFAKSLSWYERNKEEQQYG